LEWREKSGLTGAEMEEGKATRVRGFRGGGERKRDGRARRGECERKMPLKSS